jgi:hypothetical protein
MKTRLGLKLVLIPLILVSLFLSRNLLHSTAQPIPGGNVLQLVAPSFANTAFAQSSDISTRLDNEAGIAAYINGAQNINLQQVVSKFRTIETQTSDYIIGSVSTNYSDYFDAHVYVNKGGWILAYYARNDPVSKIFDVSAGVLSTTKLETAVDVIASAAGVSASQGVTYYDFQYPNATKMMFVSKNTVNGGYFTIQLPSSFEYYEYSWAVQGSPCCNNIDIDGIGNPNLVMDDYYTLYGFFNSAQMSPDVTHRITVVITGYVAILYRTS